MLAWLAPSGVRGSVWWSNHLSYHLNIRSNIGTNTCSVAPGSRRIDPLPICVKPASRHGKFVYDCKDRIVCSVVVFGAGIAMIT